MVLYKLLAVMEHQRLPSTRSMSLRSPCDNLHRLCPRRGSRFDSDSSSPVPLIPAFQRLCMLDSLRFSGQQWHHYTSCAGVEDEEDSPTRFVVSVGHFGRTCRKKASCLRFALHQRAE